MKITEDRLSFFNFPICEVEAGCLLAKYEKELGRALVMHQSKSSPDKEYYRMWNAVYRAREELVKAIARLLDDHTIETQSSFEPRRLRELLLK
jgi:hypothetical protein